MSKNGTCNHGNGAPQQEDSKALLVKQSSHSKEYPKEKDLKRQLSESPSETFTPVDGGWGWVVCLASFWTNGTLFGILNTFGILYVDLLEKFKSEDGSDIAFKTSWIGTLQITMTFMMSPIVSILVDRFGIRRIAFVGAVIATAGMVASAFVNTIEVMYFTYGLCLGLGSSLVYTPSMAILGHYFKKYIGLVNGIVTFGSAVFSAVLSYLMKFLLPSAGLTTTMLVLSGLLGVLMLCAITWKPQLPVKHKELDHYLHDDKHKMAGCYKWTSKFCNFSIWRNKSYRIWVTGLPIAFLGYFVPFVHLVKHTKEVMPDANAEVLVICISATSGISRLVAGKVADFPQINRVRMQQLAFFLLGVCTMCIPLAKHFAALVVIVLIMGVCDGCFICLLAPIAFDLLGPAGAAQGLGCLLGLMSIPMTAGPPLAGLAYDYMHQYDIAFYAAGAPPIIGAIILFLMPYKQQTLHAVNITETIQAMSIENLDTVGLAKDAEPWYHRTRQGTFSEVTVNSNPSHNRVILKNIERLNSSLTLSTPNLAMNSEKSQIFNSTPEALDKLSLA